MSEVFDSTPKAWRQRSAAARAVRRARSCAADGHRVRHRRRRLRRRRGRRPPRRQGSRPRDAAAGAGPEPADRRRHRPVGPRLVPAPHPEVLAGRADPGARVAAVLTWDLGETNGTVAVRMPLHPVAIEACSRRPARWPSAAPTAPAGRRPRPPTRPCRSWATACRSTSTVGGGVGGRGGGGVGEEGNGRGVFGGDP